MDFCDLCGTTLIKGVCPHCGQVVKQETQENVYQCRDKAAACLKNQQWADAQVWVQKGYMQDPSNKELQVADLLALTQMLRIVPSAADEDARVRELLMNMGKSVKFRYVTYDLEAYRRLLHSHDLGNMTISWWELLVGLLLILGVIGALIALFRWLIWTPLVLGGLLLIVFVVWLFITT